MVKLLKLIKNFILIILLAVINGVIGNFSAICISLFASLTLIKILGFNLNISYNVLFSIIIAFGLLRGILRYFEQYFNHFIAFKILAKIRHIIFLKVRELSFPLLDNKQKGDLTSQITSDVETLEVFYAHTLSPILIALFVNGGIVIFLSLYTHYLLAINALFFFLLIGIVIPLIYYYANKKSGIIYREKLSSFSSFYLDAIKGNKDIVYNNQQNYFISRTISKTKALQKLSNQNIKRLSIVRAISDIIIIFSALSTILIGHYLSTNNLIDPLLVIVSTITILSSYGPLISLSQLPSNLNQTYASCNRLFALLEQKPLVEEKHFIDNIDFSCLSIKHLQFGYNEELVLKDINFKMNFDEIVGIKGPSGSGKSTILKLILDFYPYKGEIYFNDKELQKIDSSLLKKNVTMFSQNTYLFNDTIANNLRLAKIDASKEEMIDALKKASIYDFVMSLPNGLETIINENSDNISLGEKQRLGLARIFLRQPKLLLLDEPTSNIDALNEALILNTLKNESNMGIIIISHKDSTLNFANRIYDLKDGILYERVN